MSDLRSSLQYRVYQRLRSEAEPVDPEENWPEAVRRRPFTAYGTNAKFIACKDQEVIIAGPAETGKTLAALHKLNDLAWAHPGMQGAIVRKVQASMAGTVLLTFQHKVLPSLSPVVAHGGANPERFLYPNGSTLWVGGMDNPDKILSSERDIIYVNQAEELDLPDWETLLTRVTGRAGVLPDPQLMGDCNPAAPTHWIKTRSAKKGPLRLLEGTHRDNPKLYDQRTRKLTAQGRRTLAILDHLTGARKMRLRHGIWAVPEGAIYDVFDEVRHKVKAFKPPALWVRVVGIDPIGVNIGALFSAWDPKQERLNVYAEYLEPFGVTTQGHAENLRKMAVGQTIWAWICGAPGERQHRVDWGGALGVAMLAPPDVPVWTGIDRVYELMDQGHLVVHDSCPNLLSEIGSYQRKRVKGQMTEQIEAKERYHLLDCLRYIVVWLVGEAETTQVREIRIRAGPDW